MTDDESQNNFLTIAPSRMTSWMAFQETKRWTEIWGGGAKQVIYFAKTEVKLSLCLITLALCHEDIRRSGDIAPPFFTSLLDGGDWSASLPSRFSPGESSPISIGWEAGWVLESVWTLWRRGKILSCRESNPDGSARRYTDFYLLPYLPEEKKGRNDLHNSLKPEK
jgi:hypothetical protein